MANPPLELTGMYEGRGPVSVIDPATQILDPTPLYLEKPSTNCSDSVS